MSLLFYSPEHVLQEALLGKCGQLSLQAVQEHKKELVHVLE